MKRQRHQLTFLLIATTLMILSSGCATGRRAIFIDADKSVFRIGPDVKGRVYFKNEKGEWELTRNKTKLKEGYYVGSGK